MCVCEVSGKSKSMYTFSGSGETVPGRYYIQKKKLGVRPRDLATASFVALGLRRVSWVGSFVLSLFIPFLPPLLPGFLGPGYLNWVKTSLVFFFSFSVSLSLLASLTYRAPSTLESSFPL